MDADLQDLDLERAEATLLRYVGAGPRYTSYPTAPVWSERYGPEAFRADLEQLAARAPAELSVYVHVPFCRSLCHFCACNRTITRDPRRPERYLDTLEREIDAVRALLPGDPRVAQHHWGGGTPTHLAPAQVRRLFRAASGAFPLAAGAEVSIEVDPRVTTPEHVEALRECGFNRISLGVQDFDPQVQRAIHRIQSAEQTAALVDLARKAGFEGVGFDLIYGLPFQSVESFTRTLERVIGIGPDRIALYAYAHVTWVAKQQRGFERHDLPDPRTRIRIFAAALGQLREAGYLHIGLDHFARPDDELSRALREGSLRRNFMGYTTRAGLELLGFGPSGISELAHSYAQSQRELGTWDDVVRRRGLATLRGHSLSRDDEERRWVIARIMCHGAADAGDYAARFGGRFAERFAPELARLAPLAEDGIVEIAADGGLRATPLGRLVVRNVAMAFDAYLPPAGGEPTRFSQTV